MGLEVVLASGEVVWLGNKCVKDVAGYNLRDLFIGSEGTLGIVTRVLLKLVPQPAARRTLLASFTSIEAAGDTVSDIIAAKIIPCTLEFLDQQTIRCVEDFAHVGLPTDAAAVLIMETDGHPQAVAEEAAAMAAIAAAARRHRRAHRGRRCGGGPAAHRTAQRVLGAGPRAADDDSRRRDRAAQRAGRHGRLHRGDARRGTSCSIGTFGHMGDGNLHPTFLTDERDADEMHRVELALGEIVDRTLRRRRHDHRRARRRAGEEAVSRASNSATIATNC